MSDLHKAIVGLKADGTINFFRIDDSYTVVSLSADYVNGDPNIGYSSDTEAKQKRIDEVMQAHGLHFSDAGGEDGGESNEFWIYRADPQRSDE